MVPLLSRGRWPAALAAATLLTTTVAVAQTAVGNGNVNFKLDPLNPHADVPALRYGSALAAYRRIGEDKPLGWKDANDAALRIGGWRTYAREAASPASAAASTPPGGSTR